MRTLIVETPLDEATVWGAETMRSGMRLFVSTNTFFGLAAVGAMMFRFADIALGPPGDVKSVEDLRARGDALREGLAVGSAILTSATVATYFYYHYPLSIMTEASAKIFAPLSALGALRWGAVYATILIAASAPAIAAQILDGRRLGGAGADADAASWLNKDAWADRLKALGAVLALIAPAAATPVLEVLAELFK